MLCTSGDLLFSTAYTIIYGFLPPIILLVALVLGIKLRDKWKKIPRSWFILYVIAFVGGAVAWICFMLFVAGGPCPPVFLQP